MAVLRVRSLEGALGLAADAGKRDPERSRADDDAEELTVGDPWVDPARPHSSTLDGARQLREALIDQPDQQAVLNAVGALSPDEKTLIVLELALDACVKRSQAGGASAERGEREQG